MRSRLIGSIKDLSLRTKMILGGTLIIIIPIIVIGTITYIQSSRASESAARTQLLQIAKSLSGMIQMVLRKDLENINAIASDPQIIRAIANEEKVTARAKLAELYTIAGSDYEGLTIFNKDGTIYSDGVDPKREGISIKDRTYYRDARNGNGGVYPVVLSKATGAPVFIISAPLTSEDGEFIGGVMGVVKIDFLLNFISSIKIGKTGYAFILNRQGVMIAHPDKKNILALDVYKEAGLEYFADELHRRSSGAGEYTYEGKTKIGGFAPVEFSGWTIGVAQNKEEIMSPARSYVTFILLVCGFLTLLAGAAVFIFSGRLSIPVQKKLSFLNQALEQAMEATQAGVWEANPSAKTVSISDQWYAMLGYSPGQGDAGFEKMEKFVHPDDLPVIRRAMQDYIASGGKDRYEAEFRLRKNDGTWCWVFSKAKAVRWSRTGMPERIIGLDINIQNVKDAQIKLAQSEAKFRAIFDHAPYAISISRLEDGQYLEANNVFMQERGITKEELLSGRILDYAVLSEEEAQSLVDQLLGEGAIKNHEAAIRVNDDHVAHVIYSATLLELEGQQHILAMVVDVTERKRAEEALKESEARFRTLFRMAPLPLAEISGNEVIEINDRFSTILGYTLGDLPTLDHWWRNAFPDPDYRTWATGNWNRQVEKALEAGTEDVQPGEFKVTDKSGNVHTMIIGASMIGQRILVSLFDITDRKREEAARIESLELLRATLNATPDGIMVVNNDLKVTQANRQLYQMWRIPDALHAPVDESALREFVLDQLEDPAGFVEMLEKLYNSQLKNVNEIAFKDGRVFESYSAPMVLNENEIGRVWDFRDTTERKQAEAEREKLQGQLLRAQKLEAIGILAGGVAHDFNNILGAIMGYTELTLKGMSTKDPFRGNLSKILDAAQRSAALIRQLLIFARKHSVTPVLINLNAAVKNMLQMLQRLIGENIELTWLPAEASCTVRMDPSQLDQILANLCVNARDAIADIGRITIKSDVVSFDETTCSINVDCVPGDYVQLTVIDNGCGIEKEAAQHIFEPFFTTKAVGKGTGLGLSTVYGIVKENNGFFNFYSEPAMGTTFNIFLPFHASSAAKEQTLTDGDIPRGQGETILMVEDDPTFMDMGKVMLEFLGYEVLSAATPNEAVTLVGNCDSEIHLFISDVVMPEMNGRELIDRLLEIRPGVKHLFMSGYAADVIVDRGIMNRCGNFIQKPFTLKEMAVNVRNTLES